MPNSDSDWDFPLLTDDDLRAIDSAISSAQLPKRHHLSCRNGDDDEGASVNSPPKSRRRLPTSLFVYRQQQRKGNFSTAPFSRCSSRRYHGRNSSQDHPFRAIKFGGRIIYSRTTEEVEKAALKLLNFAEAKKRNEGQCILGLDIEWRPTFKRGVPQGKAAVMQICGDNSSCHVLHIIHSGIPESLRRLLEDSTSFKVGVGVANDATKILKDYDVSINTLRDVSDIANQKKVGGGPKKWSLSSLTEMLICKELPKPNRIRLGNWEFNPLSSKQLKYAATDAYVSWYLYEILNNYPDPVVNEATETDAT